MSLKLKLCNIPQCYSCPQCQQIFKSALHLKYHKFRVHNSRRPYICRSCRRTFHSVCELRDHRRLHDDSPIMQCHVCDECFPTRKLLKQHMGIHTHYEGDHECGYCMATFLSLSDARLHVLLVHDDTSVLPPCRVRKKSAVSESEVFTVKEGDGLKLKLKRKMSLEGDEYSMEKAGSHTSDSGRGNSDIDDDDYNKLLKTPTFIPKHETQQQQFNQTESHLLLKPKLEIGASASWTSNKYQPRIGSADFLQKNNFLSKPQAGFGQQSALGSFAPKTSQAPLFGQPSLSKPFTTPSFGMISHSRNGSLFKTPLYNKNSSVFSSPFSTNTFGMTPFKPGINPAFGGPSPLLRKLPNGFLPPQPIKQSPVTIQSNVSSPASTDSGPIPIKKEAIFGSKEHTRSIMLPEEEKPNAFEKYAGNEQADMNPFAEAMMQAKNPPPRLDSELSETSYESESTSESEDALIDTEDLMAPEVPMTPRIEEIQAEPEPVKSKPVIHEPPLYDLPPPTPYLSPLHEPVHEHVEPESIKPEPEPLPFSPAPPSPEPLPPRQSPRKSRRGKSPKQPSPITSSLLVNGNLYESPKYADIEPEKTNGIPSPPPPRANRRGTRRSSSSKPTAELKSKLIEPPTPLMNGDVGHAPSEISGLIDLEVPSFMINIPRSLVNEPSAKARSRNNSGVKPRPGRPPGGRTPARTPARTPNRTPSRTPLYNTNFDIVPPTPIMPDIPEKPMRTPTRMSSRKFAPSKEEMMKKHEQQAKKIVKPKSPKKRIGPKSYMKSIDEYREESEEEEIPPDIEPMDVEDGSFAPEEVNQETSAGRTDVHAHHYSSLKQNTKFLLYLRQRALDMLIILFPHIRVGGHFSTSTDVDGLIDYLISTLNGDDGMRRVMHSQSSKRDQCKVVVNRSTKYEIKQLRSRIIKLLKLCFPLLTLDTVTKQGIDAIPKLIQKIITENS